MLAVNQTVYEDDSSCGKNAADANREKSQTSLLDVEVIDGREDQRKGGEKGIEDGEVESDIPRPSDDDWLADEHSEWPEEGEMEQELQSGQTCGALGYFEAE